MSVMSEKGNYIPRLLTSFNAAEVVVYTNGCRKIGCLWKLPLEFCGGTNPLALEAGAL